MNKVGILVIGIYTVVFAFVLFTLFVTPFLRVHTVFTIDERYEVTEGPHKGRWGNAWSKWFGLRISLNVEPTEEEIREQWDARLKQNEQYNYGWDWHSHLGSVGRSHVEVWRWQVKKIQFSRERDDREHLEFNQLINKLHREDREPDSLLEFKDGTTWLFYKYDK